MFLGSIRDVLARIRRWLTRPVLLIVIVIVIAVELLLFSLREPGWPNAVWAWPTQNQGVIAGLAFVGLVFGLMMTFVLARVAQNDPLEQRFHGGAALLDSERPSVRRAGIESLELLANDSPRAYQARVIRVLEDVGEATHVRDDLRRRERGT